MVSWRIKYEGYLKTNVPPNLEIDSSPQLSERLPKKRFSVMLRAFLALLLAALLVYTGFVRVKTTHLDGDCPAVCFHIMPFDTSAIIFSWLINTWFYVSCLIIFGYIQWSSVRTSLSTVRNFERTPGSKYARLLASGLHSPGKTRQIVDALPQLLRKGC